MSNVSKIPTKTLLAVVVESENVDNKIWDDIKTNIGVYNKGDFDFIVWTEETEKDLISAESKAFIEKILNNYPDKEISIISFQ